MCQLQQKMFDLATGTFLQVPVPVQVPGLQVPVLGMQLQVPVPVAENCT